MQERNVHARIGAAGGAACALLAASVALAAPPQPSSLDGDAPVASKAATPPLSITRFPVQSQGDDGGIAGSTVIYTNGPLSTGEALTCVPGATRSTVQNQPPVCLGVAGFNATAFVLADNFILTQCAEINKVRLFAIEANAATLPSITGGTVTLHSGRPWATSSNVVASSSTIFEPPSLLTVFRASLTTATPCIRPIQQLVLDTSSWPVLPPGNYSISWQITGPAPGPPAGYFTPPVTLLGVVSPPGANGQQSSATVFPATFNFVFDTGSTVAPCVAFPAPGQIQELPFILEGELGCGPCTGDTDNDGDIDADDLTNVILQWGSTCPCNADVDGDNDVDSDDLTLVILGWGPCGAPPAPPVSTGACCVGASCSVLTFGACVNAGGTYFGDGTTCAGIGSCGVPANDDCAGATTVGLGTFSVNTTLATNSPEPVDAACAFQASRDVWYSFQTGVGVQYTVDTLQTPAGLGNVADTVLVVYSGACGSLVTVNCNDDSAPSLLSSLTFAGDGSVFRIRVGTFVAAQATVAAGGNITVDISSP